MYSTSEAGIVHREPPEQSTDEELERFAARLERETEAVIPNGKTVTGKVVQQLHKTDDDEQRERDRRFILRTSLESLVDGFDRGCSLEDMAIELDAMLQEIRPGDDPEIAAMSAAELDDGDFTLTYLVEDVLVECQPAIVAAPKKSLKTNCMIDLTLSLASGAKFLGEFYVPQPKRVALLSGESGKATIQETARRVAKSKPWMNLRDYQNALFGFDLPNFADDRAMKALRDFIHENEIDVLIVDPAYLCLCLDDASNLFKVGAVLRPFTRLAEEEGVTPVIVHHFTKATAVTETVPDMESIAWAGFQEWMRQWLLMSRRSKYNADNAGHHELWFAAGGSAGHSIAKALDIDEGSHKDAGGRRWDVTVKGVGEAIGELVDEREQLKEQRQEAKAERQREKDIEAVTSTLKANPDGLTFTKLRERSGVRHSRLQRVLLDLKDSKAVSECTIKAANKAEYPGYKYEAV